MGANGQSWDARNPFAVGGPVDNTDGFHVFRIAQQPYSGSGGTVYSVWRDGVLLSDSLGSGLNYTIAPRMFFADASSNIGGSVEYDYLRFFPGYCPPVDVPPVGILVESSTGEVVFRDDTSRQITSDIWGSQNGETLSFAFIDPLTGVRGTVSRVGFRLGSVAPDNVTAEFYDLEGDLLALLHPDVGVMPEGLAADAYNSTVGFQSLLDGVETSLIHKVVFTGAGADAWVIGSFSGSDATTLNDVAFNGFRIPEPATTALLGLGLAGLLARSRRRRRSA